MKDKIYDLVLSSVLKLTDIQYLPKVDILTPQERYGDFSTNVALLLAPIVGKPVIEITGFIARDLENNSIFQKVEATKNGFVNFTINLSCLQKTVEEIIGKGSDYGKSFFGNGKRVLIEFVSANPTGPLHVGHGRWAVIGDDIANLFEAVGYKVDREYYINDVGNQINKLEESVLARMNGEPIPSDGYGGEYILEIAEKLKAQSQQSKESVLAIILSDQKKTLENLGVRFDAFFSESTLHKENKVKDSVFRLQMLGHTFNEENALWFKSQAFGDDKNRVLVRENGETTYFAADIAYHVNKFERGYDQIINIWGADHHGYVPRLKSALLALGLDVSKFEVIIGQLVSLFYGAEPVRMSKRTGEMVTLNEVINEVGVDAARFFMAMTSVNSHLSFDLELAKQSAPNNPVYYVQYAHARICSIFNEYINRKGEINNNPNLSLLIHPSERKLMRLLVDLPDEILIAAKKMSPHFLIEYVKNVAVSFHNFYHKCRVISDDEELSSARLKLLEATRITIKNVLKLLKVSAPERM